MKLLLATTAIRGRQLLPTSNRFEALRSRDNSAEVSVDTVNPAIRDRSYSTKRKLSVEGDDPPLSQASKRKQTVGPNTSGFPEIPAIDKKVKYMRSICNRVS